jgi:hypothetical protein
MALARQFLVMVSLMFWQGGFTFYAAVVVPIGRSEFGDSVQGLVTRRVTDYLNLSGGVALAILAWDVAAAADSAARRRMARWLCWAGMAATLVALVWLHPRLEVLMDAEKYDRFAFRPLHRLYLWVCTVQWGFAIVFTGLTLWAWKAGPRAAG